MRYLLLAALLPLVACDDDDPSDLVEACRLEVAFLVDGDGRCMTGFATTENFGMTVTNIALTGVERELLTFTIAELAEGDNDIPEASASYTDPTGRLYTSLPGGLLTVTDLDSDLDADFSFRAVEGVDTVEIARGVIENLGFR